jgi:hypothetical protein
VFISELTQAQPQRLAVMDQDGANPVFLTQGDYSVLTPLQPDGADDRLYVLHPEQAARLSLRPRNRPSGSARKFPQYDIFSTLFTGREERCYGLETNGIRKSVIMIGDLTSSA